MALKGEIQLPGDKSISHRALMLSALTNGVCRLENLNKGADVQSTRMALSNCGISILQEGEITRVEGKGIRPFSQPHYPINCNNSGTTARLLMGLLAGHPIHANFTGDASLEKRPMDRVIRPLQQMGANISARDRKYLPLMLSGRELWALNYDLPFASAQVKSAILFAGLWAQGETQVKSPATSRDHTERMLTAMGAAIRTEERRVHISPLVKALDCIDIHIPGDFSAAAFFLAAGTLVPGSELILRNVGINPTRTAFLDVLLAMGADITVANRREEHLEAVADLKVRASSLKGITVYPEQVPNLIDELPLIALLASQAEGETRVSGAEELRVKESDRITAIVRNLSSWGVSIFEAPDGFSIQGPVQLSGGHVKTFNDHRIAMTMAVGGLISRKPAKLDNLRCVDISYPEFFKVLSDLDYN